MPTPFRPRLSIDITEEQSFKLLQHLDHGMRKVIFGLLIDDLINLFEKHGAGPIIGLLIERSITIKEICRIKLGD